MDNKTADILFVGKDYWTYNEEELQDIIVTAVDKEFAITFPPIGNTYEEKSAWHKRRIEFLRKALIHETAHSLMDTLGYYTYYEACDDPTNLHKKISEKFKALFLDQDNKAASQARYNPTTHTWKVNHLPNRPQSQKKLDTSGLEHWLNEWAGAPQMAETLVKYNVVSHFEDPWWLEKMQRLRHPSKNQSGQSASESQ